MDLEALPPEPAEGPATPGAGWDASTQGLDPTAPPPTPPRWSLKTRVLTGAVAAVTVGAGAFVVARVIPSDGGSQINAANAAATSTNGNAPARRRVMRGVAGKVSNLNGPAFTVTSSAGGTTATTNVVTGSSTTYSKTQKGAVGDVKPNDVIAAKGTRSSDGSLAATTIDIVPPNTAKPGAAGRSPIRKAPGAAAPTPSKGATQAPSTPRTPPPVAVGTVQSVSGGVITITTPGGTQKITTSASTTVIETVAATATAVTNGATVVVTGTPSSDGSHLDATHVEVIDPALVGAGLAGPGGRMFGPAGGGWFLPGPGGAMFGPGHGGRFRGPAGAAPAA